MKLISIYAAYSFRATCILDIGIPISNVVITTQAQLLHGDIYGLIFRLNPHSRQFYVLELNSQSDYRFVLAPGSNPSTGSPSSTGPIPAPS